MPPAQVEIYCGLLLKAFDEDYALPRIVASVARGKASSVTHPGQLTLCFYENAAQ